MQRSQYPLIRCDDVCISVNCRHSDYFDNATQREKDGNSGAPNQKVVYKIATITSFQTSAKSALNSLIDVYMSVGSEENACYLLSLDIGTGNQHVVQWHGQPLVTRHARLQFGSTDGSLNADQHISDILRPMVVPYLRFLPKAIFEQDNEDHMLPVIDMLLTFLDTQDIQLLLWPA